MDHGRQLVHSSVCLYRHTRWTNASKISMARARPRCCVKLPAYIAEIARMLRDGVIPRGQVVHVDVAHDAGCGMLTGDGVCSCRPLVTVGRAEHRGRSEANPMSARASGNSGGTNGAAHTTREN